MYAIKLPAFPQFIRKNSDGSAGATFSILADSYQFPTVQDAVNFVHTFHGEVVEEDIDETGATIAMSGHPRDLRIYEVVEIK